MAFRGMFALNGTELINSSRTAAHIGADVPTSDVGIINPLIRCYTENPPGSGLYDVDNDETPPLSGLYDTHPHDFTSLEVPDDSGLYNVGECQLTEVSALLFEVPPTSSPIPGKPGFYSPPDGAYRYSEGLFQIDVCCWKPHAACGNCRPLIRYDDSWPGLQAFLDDVLYRVELAPWYTVLSPESGEFLGIWLYDVQGLGATPVQRSITELVGSGAVAAPHRDTSRTITFDALLIACSNAGLEYGKDWLTCRLRETISGSESSLRFLSAHPSHTAADPDQLLRDLHGLVLTKAPEVREALSPGGNQNQQATMYRVSWEMVALRPYIYLPPVEFDVNWDEISAQSISWVHDPDCSKPLSCEAMPVLFSATCKPETIDLPTEPPPVCGGCIPLCQFMSHVYHLPTLTYPLACRETAVNMTITNMSGSKDLTLQAYLQECGTNVRCEDHQFPLQVSGLPANGRLQLDSINSKYWAELNSGTPSIAELASPRRYTTRGIVGTPTGAPWRPTIIDRQQCWQLVVVAAPDADFEISISLADREP